MLNETLWVMIYTAKMMATLPEKNNTGNVTVIQDTRPMSLLPEEMGNQTDLHDSKYPIKIGRHGERIHK